MFDHQNRMFDWSLTCQCSNPTSSQLLAKYSNQKGTWEANPSLGILWWIQPNHSTLGGSRSSRNPTYGEESMIFPAFPTSTSSAIFFPCRCQVGWHRRLVIHHEYPWIKSPPAPHAPHCLRAQGERLFEAALAQDLPRTRRLGRCFLRRESLDSKRCL